MKKHYANFQSHDNGNSWRIIDNWEFKRLSNIRISFAGMYSGRKNYNVSAVMRDGEIVIYNPRDVKIPQYAIDVVKDMFTYQPR